jgi:hypothetical protein
MAVWGALFLSCLFSAQLPIFSHFPHSARFASLRAAPTWLRHVPPRSARLAIFWTHSARFPLFSRSPRSARHPLILLRSAPKVKSQKVPSQMRRPQLPTRQMSCLVIIILIPAFYPIFYVFLARCYSHSMKVAMLKFSPIVRLGLE